MKPRSIGIFLAWLVTAAAAAKIVAIPLYDPDVWWHLAAGREMARSHALLRTDIFSHTLYGTPWINFEWLGQLFFFEVHRYFGEGGLIWLKVVAAPLVLLMVARMLKEAGAHGVWLWLGTWVSFLTVVSRLYERIELFSLFLIPALLYVVLHARRLPEAHLRFFFWIPTVMAAVWCNLHGGFLYGWGAVVLLDIGARWAKERPAYIRFLDRSALGMAVGTLINPWGPRLYQVFWEHGRIQGQLSFLMEWQPTTVFNLPFFWAVYILAGVVLVRGLIQKNAAARLWAPAALIYAVWGAQHYRNATIAVMVLMPALVMVLSAKEFVRVRKWPLPLLWATALILLAVPFRALARPWPNTTVYTHRFPVEAVTFLDKNNIRGTVYNAYEFGGYLAWMRGPEEKIFMDGRYLFMPQLLSEINLDRRASATEWKAYLDRARIDYAVVSYNATLIQTETGQMSALDLRFPADDWALVYWDDAALVYVKRQFSFRTVIQGHEYSAVRPASLEWTLFRLNRDPHYRNQVRQELRRHQQEVGNSVLSRMLLAETEKEN